MSSATSTPQGSTEVTGIQQTIRPQETTRLRHGFALLGRNRRREPLSSLGSPALDYGPTRLRLHARPETVLAESLDPTRLKSPLHGCGSSAFSRSGMSNRLDPGRFRIVCRTIVPRSRHTRGVSRRERGPAHRLAVVSQSSQAARGRTNPCEGQRLPAVSRLCQCRIRSTIEDDPSRRIQIARVTLPTALASSRPGAGLLSRVSFRRSASTNGEGIPNRPLEAVLSVSPSLSTTTSLFSNPRRREDR
jgi:hypothetical protein